MALAYVSGGIAGTNNAIAGNEVDGHIRPALVLLKSNPQSTPLMNKTSMKGNWNITKGKLKQKYSQLTDDDLKYVEGKEDELIGRIQKRTGETRENLDRMMRENSDT